jgi:effector-binding domain-containing protein
VPYEVVVKNLSEQKLLVIHSRANAQNIGAVITELLPEVWQYIAEKNLSRKGRNVVVYHGEEGCTFHDEVGIPVEVGVQALQDFEATDRILLSRTPGGRVASTLHIGPYQNLPQAHAAVREWCEHNGHELHGLNWEIYGHHNPNSEESETEVCYLLG